MEGSRRDMYRLGLRRSLALSMLIAIRSTEMLQHTYFHSPQPFGVCIYLQSIEHMQTTLRTLFYHLLQCSIEVF